MSKLATSPTLERQLAAQYGTVIGMDEVGRGALAGPVGVGAAVSAASEPPAGLTDSKALSAKQRDTYVELAQAWSPASAVEFSDNRFIDEHGIVLALRVAGIGALEKIMEAGYAPGVVLLDGSHNWLTPPADLFSAHDDPLLQRWEALGNPPVIMRVKADAECSVVAAASVLAKVARDKHMEALNDPGYGWASNKGYGSAAHKQALRKLGVSPLHRASWNLV